LRYSTEQAIEVRRSAEGCRVRVISRADFAYLFLSVQRRESEGGLIFSVRRERAWCATSRSPFLSCSVSAQLCFQVVRVNAAARASGSFFRADS